jgi:hypothetical protein
MGWSLPENLRLPAGKKTYAALAAAVFAALVISGAFHAYDRYSAVKRAAVVKKGDIARFRLVEAEYHARKAVVDAALRRASAQGDVSTVAVVEMIGKRTGLGERIREIKPLEDKEALGYRESGVEVKIEGVELNELVNFLYWVENGRALLVVKEFSMKKRFDRPDELDARLRIGRVMKL